MSTSTFFSYLGGLLSVAAYIPYIRSVWRDRFKPDRDPTKCKPKRACWIIWFITSWIIAVTMRANDSIYMYQAWAYCAGATVVLLLAVPYGEGGWRLIDRLSLFGALVGLIMWWLLNSAWYAFAIAMVIDGIVTVPVVKAKGKGEDPTAWILFALGTLSSCATVIGIEDKTLSPSNPRLADIVYPLGMSVIVFIPAFLVISSAFLDKMKPDRPKVRS